MQMLFNPSRTLANLAQSLTKDFCKSVPPRS
jgi:hypothetical protein